MIAIVRAASPSGVVVSEVHDLCVLAGRRWIRADEIVDIDDLQPDDPNRRLAVLRGSLAHDATTDPTDLRWLLHLLQDRGELVGVYTARTGSDECLVGPVVAIGSDELVLAEVRPDAASTGDELGSDSTTSSPSTGGTTTSRRSPSSAPRAGE